MPLIGYLFTLSSKVKQLRTVVLFEQQQNIYIMFNQRNFAIIICIVLCISVQITVESSAYHYKGHYCAGKYEYCHTEVI